MAEIVVPTETKQLIPFGSCAHKNIDFSWSHGMAGRCLGCGAIKDMGVWDDIVSKIALCEFLAKHVSLPKSLAQAHVVDNKKGYRNLPGR